MLISPYMVWCRFVLFGAWKHVAIVTVIHISWWMCYASLWIQAPADGFDPVHVFWMAENKYVNKEENTVAPGDNSLWVKVFLGIFLQICVLEGGWWTSVYLIGSEWGDHRADGLETVLKHWQLQQDFSLDVGAFHCSYFSPLSPAKKCAEPLMWFLY